MEGVSVISGIFQHGKVFRVEEVALHIFTHSEQENVILVRKWLLIYNIGKKQKYVVSQKLHDVKSNYRLVRCSVFQSLIS